MDWISQEQGAKLMCIYLVCLTLIQIYFPKLFQIKTTKSEKRLERKDYFTSAEDENVEIIELSRLIDQKIVDYYPQTVRHLLI